MAKQTKKRPAKRKTVSAKKGKPAETAVKTKPRRKRRITRSKKIESVSVSQPPAPKNHHHFRTLSLLLILAASMTNGVVAFASSQDIKRYDREARADLAELISPRAYLYEQAAERNLDARLLDRIAFCESNWRMVRSKQSSAYGFFQIIDATEASTPQYKAGQRKFDPYTNVDMALYLFERYGSSPWVESRACLWWYE